MSHEARHAELSPIYKAGLAISAGIAAITGCGNTSSSESLQARQTTIATALPETTIQTTLTTETVALQTTTTKVPETTTTALPTTTESTILYLEDEKPIIAPTETVNRSMTLGFEGFNGMYLGMPEYQRVEIYRRESLACGEDRVWLDEAPGHLMIKLDETHHVEGITFDEPGVATGSGITIGSSKEDIQNTYTKEKGYILTERDIDPTQNVDMVMELISNYVIEKELNTKIVFTLSQNRVIQLDLARRDEDPYRCVV